MRQMRKDQQVQVVGMVQTSPGRYLLQGKKELAGNLQQGLPDSAEGIQNFSAIILGNQNKPALNEQDALILKQYVENGGSLILLGGKDSFVKDRIPNALEGMLPFSTLQQSYQTGKFIFTTAGLQASGFQRQMDQLIETNNGNIGLTAINRFQGLRPNAQIALYAQGEEKLPIVVWQDWGQGKVLTILTNQTQNLGSTAVRNQNFMTFMKQALTLSQNRNDLHDTLSFALSKNFVSPQETTKIIALVKGEVQETTEVIGDVFKHGSDQPIQSVELQALSELQYEGEIQALPPGDYVLRVQVLKEGQSIRKRYKMLTVGQVQQELADLAVNDRNWDAICPPHRRFQLSEGTALESALLQAIRKKMVRKEIFPFWETPWLLIILILTLLTEWYLRRRYNLF